MKNKLMIIFVTLFVFSNSYLISACSNDNLESTSDEMIIENINPSTDKNISDNANVNSEKDVSTNNNPGADTSSKNNVEMEKEIKIAEQTSKNNKQKYKEKYLYYQNLGIYKYDYSQYTKDHKSLEDELLNLNIQEQTELNKAASNGFGTGAAAASKNKIQNKYNQLRQEVQAKIDKLELEWENKQSYNKYKKLYDDEDARLEQEIENIKKKYN
jgi:hypothetical protein